MSDNNVNIISKSVDFLFYMRNIYGKEEHKVPCILGVENCGVKRRMDSIPSYISHLYMEWRTVE
jgi:hypothetical protein